MISVEYLCKWKLNKRIAIFCAGQNGYAFYQILKLVNIKVDCFVDNSPEKWGKYVVENVKCYSPKILSGKKEYITFICVNPYLYKEIHNQAVQLGVVHIERMNDIIDDMINNYRNIYMQILKELPFGKESELFYEFNPNKKLLAGNDSSETVSYDKNRIAVYTSVFGNYDEVFEPECNADNVDYYFVSDRKPPCLSRYKWIDAAKIMPDNIKSPIKRNRFVKMHPHLLFPEYQYSIYIDGNVKILEDISSFIKENKSGISVFMHPWRDSIFYEALAIVNYKRVCANDVSEQMNQYLLEGMPIHYGLPEMMVIAREHHKDICVKIMEDWWKEFDAQSQRDQLSFMYVMWKNGMKLSDMTSLGDNSRECRKIQISKHSKDSKSIVNEDKNNV